MRSSRYPLDALIEMRREDLDRAQESFSTALEDSRRARMAVDAARRGVQEAERALTDLEDRFRIASMQRAVPARRLESFPARRSLLNQRLAAARDALGAARKVLVEAEEREEAARAALAEARKELEVVERHKKRWSQEKRARRVAAEDELAEELAARRTPESR